MLQKRLAWAFFVLLFSTLVCFQPTELNLGFLFQKISFSPPPQPGDTSNRIDGSVADITSHWGADIKYISAVFRGTCVYTYGMDGCVFCCFSSVYSSLFWYLFTCYIQSLLHFLIPLLFYCSIFMASILWLFSHTSYFVHFADSVIKCMGDNNQKQIVNATPNIQTTVQVWGCFNFELHFRFQKDNFR